MKRRFSKICSIALCMSMLMLALAVPAAPSASALSLFGDRSALIERIGKAAEEFEVGSDARRERWNAIRESAGETVDRFREEHPELEEGLSDARDGIQQAAGQIREELESRLASQESGALPEASEGGSELSAPDEADSGEEAVIPRLDVSRRIEERIAEQKAQAEARLNGREAEPAAQAADRTPAENGASDDGADPSADRSGGSQEQPGESEDPLASLRERLEKVRQDFEKRVEEASTEDDSESFLERLASLRSELEEAARNPDADQGEALDKIREKIDQLEEQIREDKQSTEEEGRETKEKFWMIGQWIQHPKEMLLFRLLQRLAQPRTETARERSDRAQSETGWNPDGGGAASVTTAAAAASPTPSPSPSPEVGEELETEEEPEEEEPEEEELEEEELEEEAVPLALPVTEPEPEPIRVTPWYLRTEFILAILAIAGVGSFSAVSAVKPILAAKRKDGEEEKPN